MQGGVEDPLPWRVSLHNAVASANKKAAAKAMDKSSKLEMYRAMLPWGIGIKSPMLRGKKGDTEPWFNRNVFGKRADQGVEEFLGGDLGTAGCSTNQEDQIVASGVKKTPAGKVSKSWYIRNIFG